MNMCRFYGLNDPEYEKVASCLQEIVKEIRHPPTSRDHAFRVEPEISAPDLISEGDSTGIDRHQASAARPLEMDSRPRLPLLSPISEPTGSPSDDFLKGKKEAEVKLVESLSFDQLGARFLNISVTHGITCQWFLSTQEYDDWQRPGKHNPNSWFLWIKGKPGTGKSTLMKYLHSTRRQSESPGIVLSFFFNARGSQLEQSTIGCYRALLFTLLHSREDLWSCLDHLGSAGTGYILNNDWTVESLTQTFALAVQLAWTQLHQPIEIWIDALDECDEYEVRKMVSFFEDLADLADHQSIDLKICFASRHYPSVTSVKGIDVALERQEKHNEDIARYIEAKLHIGEDRADGIKAELLRKGSGIFLWVVLVVDILNREYARGNVMVLRKRLDEIPADLHSVFESILTKDNKNMGETIRCLQLLLYSTRPLKPPELFVAATRAMEPKSPLQRWDLNEPPMTPEDLQRWVDNASRGLAQVTRPSSRLDDHNSHQTTFRSRKSTNAHDKKMEHMSYHDYYKHDKFEITETDNPVAKRTGDHGPWYEAPGYSEYEADFELDASDTSMPLPRRVPIYTSGLHSTLARPSRGATSSRINGLGSVNRRLYGSNSADDVAVESLPRQWLTEGRVQPYQRPTSPNKVRLDDNYTPTVQFIHESVRDFLLGKSSTRYQWTGLSNFGALGTGHEMLEDLCMDHVLAAYSVIDSPVEFKAEEYPFVPYAIHNLFAHAERACEVGVSQDNLFQMFPLHLATWHCLWRMFKVSSVETTKVHGTSVIEDLEDTPHLLHLLATLNAPHLICAHPDLGRQFRRVYTSSRGHIHTNSPWETAIITHSFEALRELVNASTTDPSTKLTLEEVRSRVQALRYKHYVPQKLELTAGSWCNTTILLSSFGHCQLLERFLLQIGEDECRCGISKNLEIPKRCENNLGDSCLETIRQIVNQHDCFGRTALFYVTTKEMGELLLAYGADPRALERQLYGDETALHFALRTDNVYLLRFLRELHLLVVRPPPVYQTIDLDHAHDSRLSRDKKATRQTDGSRGHSQKRLKKFDSNIKDGLGLTPLSCAVQLKNVAMVEFLLDGWPELDPNIPDDRGMTPLAWAVVANENKIVELLITRCPNVNPNATIPDGLTPFCYAVALRFESIVELLIENCPSLDSNLPDIEGRTPLSWAAHGFKQALPSPKMIQDILTNPLVAPDQQDFVGKSPLRWVAEGHWGRLESIKHPSYLHQFVKKDGKGHSCANPAAHMHGSISNHSTISIEGASLNASRPSPPVLSILSFPGNWDFERDGNDNDRLFRALRLLLSTKKVNPFRKAADGLSPFDFLSQLPTLLGPQWDEKARNLWLEMMECIACTWPSDIPENFHQDLDLVKSTLPQD